MTSDNSTEGDDERVRDVHTQSTAAVDATAITLPYKVLGDFEDANGGIGVLGRNTAGSGSTIGVEGRVDSPSGYGLYTPDDARVDGEAELSTLTGSLTNGSPVSTLPGAGLEVNSGTLALTESVKWQEATAPASIEPVSGYADLDLTGKSNGTMRANYAVISTGISNALEATTSAGGGTAVDGVASAATGSSTGVYGESHSSKYNAIGVEGRLQNSTGSGAGVYGSVYSTGGGVAGTKGRAFNSTGTSYGVEGITDSRTDGAVGVRGEAGATTGEVYGVLGTTNSGTGYGVYTPDDARVGGDFDVGGSQTVGNLGVSAYQSANQTISSGLGTTVIAFDTAVADDRGELDPSTGEFVCAEAGSYRVSAGAEWLDQLPGDTLTQFNIMLNGGVHTRMRDDVTGAASATFDVAHRTSRTLRGLSAGDTITIALGQNSGSSKDLLGGKANTWVTIEQVG